MSRRALDTSAPVDEDIRALMEDIDASLADFERRLAAEHTRQPDPATSKRTTTLRPGPAMPAPPLAEQASRTEPAAAGGLLAELELEAQQGGGAGDADKRRKQREVHDALNRVFGFFDLFCRHTNKLQPAIARVFRLDSRTAYSSLRWDDAMVKSRRQGLSEAALLDYVSFRVRLLAPAPVTVPLTWDKLEAFKKDMDLLDLRAAEGMDLDDIATSEEPAIRLAADFPVQIAFSANYDNGRIDILSRNLEGFGIAAFVCAPDEITSELLDGLGRYLLARGNTLPPALHRVHSRAEL